MSWSARLAAAVAIVALCGSACDRGVVFASTTLPCTSDGDCKECQICDTPPGVCGEVTGECKSDSDCGPDRICELACGFCAAGVVDAGGAGGQTGADAG